jgi:hypothetical protein
MSNADPPLVVKLGGSLYAEIPSIIPVLAASGRPLLVVPGGGPFADTIRESGVGDDAAHWMAIAAMEQFGWFCSSQGLGTTDLFAIPHVSKIFLPYRTMREQDPLPHSWDITSDTIAAWVAATLGIELLLLKSVDGIIINEVLQTRVDKPVICETVDPYFIPFVLKTGTRTTIINGSKLEHIVKFLKGEEVPCTKTGTTF